MTWKQAGERVKAIAAGLLSLGLEREERVGILSNTRVEWLLCDLGILSAGGATTTVYPSSTRRGVRVHPRRLRDPLRVRRGRLAARRSSRRTAPRCRSSSKLILIDGAPEAKDRDWVMTLAELEAAGAAHLAKDPQGRRRRRRRHRGRAPRDADLHVGHDRQAEGRAPAPRVLGVHRRRDGRDPADGRRRRAVPVAADVALVRQGADGRAHRVGLGDARSTAGSRRSSRTSRSCGRR